MSDVEAKPLSGEAPMRCVVVMGHLQGPPDMEDEQIPWGAAMCAGVGLGQQCE